MDLVEAGRAQLARYPESSLIDLYKSFFQDAFGAGHLLGDPRQTRLYFEKELTSMQSRGRRASEPCGLGRNFYRIPMDLIADGIVDRKEYYDSFLASASSFTVPNLASWKEEWQSIMEAITPLIHLITGFEADAKRINSLLRSDSYALGHSDHYRSAWDPHYRIFTIAEMRRLMAHVR